MKKQGPQSLQRQQQEIQLNSFFLTDSGWDSEWDSGCLMGSQ